MLKRFPFLRFGTSNSSKGDGATNGADSSDKFKGRPSLMEGLDFAGIEDADEPTTRSRGQRDAAGNISRDPKSAQLPESMQRAQRRAEERAANMKAAEAAGIKPDRPLPGTRNTQEKLKAIASRRPGRKNQ